MGLQLAKVIPWGRSFDEYLRMFALTDADLHCRVDSRLRGRAG